MLGCSSVGGGVFIGSVIFIITSFHFGLSTTSSVIIKAILYVFAHKTMMVEHFDLSFVARVIHKCKRVKFWHTEEKPLPFSRCPFFSVNLIYYSVEESSHSSNLTFVADGHAFLHSKWNKCLIEIRKFSSIIYPPLVAVVDQEFQLILYHIDHIKSFYSHQQ